MAVAAADNQTDKILIRKPDGSFEYVSVPADSADRTEATVAQPALPTRPPAKHPPAVAKPDVSQIAPPPPQETPAVKSSSSARPDSQGIDWNKIVTEVITQLPETLKSGADRDEAWLTRLKSAVLSRLRDVRDKLATQEILVKANSAGGLGFAPAEAAQVSKMIDKFYQQVHQAPSSSSKSGFSNRQFEVTDMYRPSASLEALIAADVPVARTGGYEDMLSNYLGKKSAGSEPTEKIAPAGPPAPKIPAPQPPAPAAPAAPRPTTPQPTPTQMPVEPTRSVPENLAVAVEPIKRPAPPAAPARPSIEDVKPRSRLMGPVEELKNMRLPDFRRLANSTDSRLDKIVDIIAGLADESFAKKVEGIKAWRHSPIYKLYIKIGNKSLADASTIDQAISALQAAGEEALTIEEFEKITDFNKQIRY